MQTSHLQGPKSHQPVRDSRTQQGLPTHVPHVLGTNRLRSHSEHPEDTGKTDKWGTVAYKPRATPPQPLILGAWGRSEARGAADPSPVGEEDRVRWCLVRGRVLGEELLIGGRHRGPFEQRPAGWCPTTCGAGRSGAWLR